MFLVLGDELGGVVRSRDEEMRKEGRKKRKKREK